MCNAGNLPQRCLKVALRQLGEVESDCRGICGAYMREQDQRAGSLDVFEAYLPRT